MRLPSFCAIGLAAFVAATATGPSAEAQSAPKTAASPRSTGTLLKLDHTKYQLDNGLTVILHQDKRQPLVAVNINVNVGSRDEAVRRTGFAHLFEHLMFMGTKRVPTGKFDAWMEREGGSNV